MSGSATHDHYGHQVPHHNSLEDIAASEEESDSPVFSSPPQGRRPHPNAGKPRARRLPVVIREVPFDAALFMRKSRGHTARSGSAPSLKDDLFPRLDRMRAGDSMLEIENRSLHAIRQSLDTYKKEGSPYGLGDKRRFKVAEVQREDGTVARYIACLPQDLLEHAA